LNFEPTRRSNSQWNITLLDYIQKTYRSRQMLCQKFIPDRILQFWLVLNEIWNKLFTYDICNWQAGKHDIEWNRMGTRAFGDSFFYNSPAPVSVSVTAKRRIVTLTRLRTYIDSNIKSLFCSVKSCYLILAMPRAILDHPR
jgi:hypothetical protein